ncbi:DUF6790 family protein [Sinorhizobium sp. BG8]|uniref:DUF6790 family protein n=1 Tax=Sinorhizobium sp. BG8 TaxID=2613773 RepID=UPI00193DCE3F|nr:DUF6790 family protein [Sinorhizobium sp. BG8]QRM54070.1 hypothetical protein F3Y30_05520 [Sinorhizobium sp. BG8]
MYYAIVILLTVALPILSIAIEYFMVPGTDVILLLGKWFVFWGVGVRLALAGFKQATSPSFTASGILGIKDPAAEKVVSELGYANLSMGLIGVLSLLWANWVPPAGLAGGLFLGLAGFKHAMNTGRNAKENLAMPTDFFVSAMIAIYLLALAVR